MSAAHKQLFKLFHILAVLPFLFAIGLPYTPVTAQNGSQDVVYLPLVMRADPPSASPIEITNNYTIFVGSDGNTHVTGEVANNTSASLINVQIWASFYGNNSSYLGTDNTNIILMSLPPHDRTCFDFALIEPFDWTNFQLGTPTYSTGGNQLPDITVVDSSGSYDSTSGTFSITGTVRNDGSSTVFNVSPVGTLYNAKGEVIGCQYTYVDIYNLNPAQTGTFLLSFATRDYSDATSYRLQVDGQ